MALKKKTPYDKRRVDWLRTFSLPLHDTLFTLPFFFFFILPKYCNSKTYFLLPLINPFSWVKGFLVQILLHRLLCAGYFHSNNLAYPLGRFAEWRDYFPSDISLRDSDISLKGTDISISSSDISRITNEISLGDSDISLGENDISSICSDISWSENYISLSCCKILLSENDIYRSGQTMIFA